MRTRLIAAFLVLLPPAANAQVLPRPAGTGGGISVSGRSLVRVPVKTLRFTALARGAVDDRAVLAAMRAAGIDDIVIGTPGSVVMSNGQTSVRGVVREVSQAKLDRIGAAAAEFVRAHPGVTIDSVAFAPRLDDCAPVEQSARVAALGDAQRKAAAIAAATGVALGGVVAVGESGGCPSDNDAFGGGQQSFDLATLTATVSVFEQVTYAIAPLDTSRRRAL